MSGAERRRTADGRAWVLRPARPGDAARLCDYLHTVYAEDAGLLLAEPFELDLDPGRVRAAIESLARTPGGLYLLGEAEGGVVACLHLRPGRSRRTAHTAELGLSVHPDWRRRGLGRTLVDAALEAARSTGVLRRVQLAVVETNEPALALFRSCGFEEEGRRRGAVRLGGAERDLLLFSRAL